MEPKFETKTKRTRESMNAVKANMANLVKQKRDKECITTKHQTKNKTEKEGKGNGCR
jgi:hypothetical protein